MFVVKDGERFLATVTNLITRQSYDQFLTLDEIHNINTYRNKDASIKHIWNWRKYKNVKVIPCLNVN